MVSGDAIGPVSRSRPSDSLPRTDLPVGHLIEQFLAGFGQAEFRGFPFESHPRVVFREPVGIGVLQTFHQQSVERLTRLTVRRHPVQAGGRHPLDGGVAAHDQRENILGQVSNPFEGIGDDGPEPLDLGARILEDFLQVEQQVVKGFGLGFDLLDGQRGIDENAGHEPGGLRPFGVAAEQVKIIQRIPARLGDDEAPVHERVRELPQKRVHPFHQPEVSVHDLLQGAVLRVDVHIDVVVRQIDFERLRFQLGRRVHDLTAREFGSFRESVRESGGKPQRGVPQD